MQKFSWIIAFILLNISCLGQNFTINGYVTDRSSGEPVIGAAVFDKLNNHYGTFTNSYGFFSLTLPKGKHIIRIMALGYKPVDTTIYLNKNLNINFQLKSATVLKEVVVTSYKNQVKNAQTGEISLPVKRIANLPVIFGEPDLMKILQLLPGIQPGTEGKSGLYVRGGSPDQNLILLDGIPLYNISHLGGLFSVFTPEAINSVTVYKSGFPAKYGGRLSSVIDVRMKNGNMNHWTGNVSIGLISSKFTIQGPVIKHKSSFILSARRTYIDLLAKPFIAAFGTSHQQDEYTTSSSSFTPGYYFYDIYTKFNYKFNDNNRIFFSLYSGMDKFFVKANESQHFKNIPIPDSIKQSYSNYDNKTNGSLKWGNQVFAIRWNHKFTDKTFSNLSFSYSKFLLSSASENYLRTYNDSINNIFSENISYTLGINDLASKFSLEYIPNIKHHFTFGLSAIYHKFIPGQFHLWSYFYNSLPSYSQKIDTTFGEKILYAPEFAAYAQDNFSVTNKLKINYGLRLTAFIIQNKFYHSIEPRISARYLISNNLSIKSSYAYVTQYLHFLTNNTVGIPLDMWLPTTKKIIPENSWQVALAVNYLFKQISFSIETYYKRMNNIIEFKEGQSLFTIFSRNNQIVSWEDKVSQGIGWSYGSEFLIRKDFGKLTGWIGYTLQWSWRQFSDINNGHPFPFKYDRRHFISIVSSYKLSHKITASAVWVYGSGTPITLVQGEMFDPAYLLSVTDCFNSECTYQGDYIYGGRNAYRLPNYQRLDISFNFYKKKKTGTRIWTIGIYNVYNHINPYFTQLIDKNAGAGKPHYILRIYSVFPVMPFFSFRFNWN